MVWKLLKLDYLTNRKFSLNVIGSKETRAISKKIANTTVVASTSITKSTKNYILKKPHQLSKQTKILRYHLPQTTIVLAMKTYSLA